MHHLSVPYNDESAVTDVCCVDGTGLTVKDHHTCCAATYATNFWLWTLNIMGEVQIIIHILNYGIEGCDPLFCDWFHWLEREKNVDIDKMVDFSLRTC